MCRRRRGNESCTNSIFVLLNWGTTPEASCNNSQLPGPFVSPVGGGGGKSNCTSSDGATPSTCTGGYPKPGWQAAPGVPIDNVRDIPDVSLFASGGFMASAYIICEADQPGRARNVQPEFPESDISSRGRDLGIVACVCSNRGAGQSIHGVLGPGQRELRPVQTGVVVRADVSVVRRHVNVGPGQRMHLL